MSNPYIGEIRMFAGTFVPNGWAACDGQELPIAENDTLFNLIGTTFGGDGQETFAVPDLRGRAPIHLGQGSGTSARILAEAGGTETVTLTTNQVPGHSHQPAAAAAAGTTATPANGVWAALPDTPYALSPVSRVAMHAAALNPSGGNQPHDNIPPYVAVRFIISLFGIYPSEF